jgi:hypothetical protein|tara:strand:- start:914 stop:1087 length:174 start_codon:yes stop_codon:yes gene_type:complete
MIVFFNVAIFYDQAQHNEEIYKSNFSLFLAVLGFFCVIELLFFSVIYVVLLQIFEAF